MLINKYLRNNVSNFKILNIRFNSHLSGLLSVFYLIFYFQFNIGKYEKFDPLDIDGCCTEYWEMSHQNNKVILNI